MDQSVSSSSYLGLVSMSRWNQMTRTKRERREENTFRMLAQVLHKKKRKANNIIHISSVSSWCGSKSEQLNSTFICQLCSCILISFKGESLKQGALRATEYRSHFLTSFSFSSDHDFKGFFYFMSEVMDVISNWSWEVTQAAQSEKVYPRSKQKKINKNDFTFWHLHRRRWFKRLACNIYTHTAHTRFKLLKSICNIHHTTTTSRWLNGTQSSKK